MRLKVIKIKTKYWRPGTNYINEIVRAVEDTIKDGDIVTVSEKAISTALNNLVDESVVEPSKLACFLAKIWIRKVWGGPLGKITRLRKNTLTRIRKFPKREGAVHKQVSLWYVGLLQSLRHYSEGGIDASNLPYSLVSLPLKNPEINAMKIKSAIKKQKEKITVILVDGDTTYSWRNLHLSPRRVPVSGLKHFGGFLTFLIGRALKFRSRSTPIAFTGEEMNPDWILTLANIAHRVRGHGAGRTVWDMSEKFGTKITDVTWEMLEDIPHYPIVIIRKMKHSDLN